MENLDKVLEWALQREQASKDVGKYKEMMLDYIESQANKLTEKACSHISKEKWPTRRLTIKKELLKSLGLDPLPPRTPLNPRLVGVIEKEDYLVEKLIFEPRPWFFTPAHLYIPKYIDFPAPAVLYTVGHWMVNSKMEPDVRACCVGLAKLGFVVLIYDPIGQGERGCSFYDHGHRDLLLLGLSQEGLMVWESMRAIDYLLTRPEVDGNRIGMTGASGGGLNTVYTCAADERITVSVPVCYVTSFNLFLQAMRGMDWNGGIDLCNQVPNVIEYADMAGICSLIAPRPLMFINGIQDPQFPIEGAKQVLEQVRSAYESLGAADRVTMVAIDSGHGYNQPMREAAYGWFKKWLMKEEWDGSPIREPQIPPETPDAPEFKCFVWGTAISSGPAITRLSKEIAQNFPPKIDIPNSKVDWPTFKERLRGRLIHILNLIPLTEKPRVIEQERYNGGELIVERIILESENGIFIPCYSWKSMVTKKSNPGKTFVFLNDEGKLADINSTILKTIIKDSALVFSLDPRSTGESLPIAPEYRTLATVEGTLETVKSKSDDTLEFEVATNCIMLGRNLIAQQVFDIIAFLNYLDYSSKKDVNKACDKTTLIASGVRSCLVALLSAAIDERIENIVLNKPLINYLALVGREDVIIPIGTYIFGILRHFDLPQIAMLVAPRLFVINRSIDAKGVEVDIGQVEEIYNPVKRIYKILGQSEVFQIKQLSISQIISWLFSETK